jgi:hypothetical protein
MVADAYATAMMAMGSQRATVLAKQRGLSVIVTVYCQSPASMGAYHAIDVTAQRTHLIFVALNSQPKVLRLIATPLKM